MAETSRFSDLMDWLLTSGDPSADELSDILSKSDNVDAFENVYRNKLRKIKGYSNIEKSQASLRDRARAEFDTFTDNPAWYIKDKAEKLGTTEDKLKETLDELEKERLYNEGRARRTKEVEDRNFIWNFLVPESSKQRYIDNPDNSMFGKEGNFNPLSTEGARDVRDVALGALGAASDFIPGYGAFTGPAARIARNAALINEESKYAPSVSDAVKEGISDLATYGAAAFLNNFRQAKRMVAGAGRNVPFVGNVLTNRATKLNIDYTKKGLQDLINLRNQGKLNYDKFNDIINKLPESQIKNDILSKKSELFTGKVIANPELEKEALDKIVNEFPTTLYEIDQVVTKTPKGYVPTNYLEQGKKTASEFKTILGDKNVLDDELLNKVISNAATEKANKYTDIRKFVRETPLVGKTGQIIRDVFLPAEEVVEQGLAKNAAHLSKAKPENPNRDKINWYKQNYARDWEAGFIPKGKDGDPIIEAYKEWNNERNAKKLKDAFGF